jgi:hypothetical protein
MTVSHVNGLLTAQQDGRNLALRLLDGLLATDMVDECCSLQIIAKKSLSDFDHESCQRIFAMIVKNLIVVQCLSLSGRAVVRKKS